MPWFDPTSGKWLPDAQNPNAGQPPSAPAVPDVQAGDIFTVSDRSLQLGGIVARYRSTFGSAYAAEIAGGSTIPVAKRAAAYDALHQVSDGLVPWTLYWLIAPWVHNCAAAGNVVQNIWDFMKFGKVKK